MTHLRAWPRSLLARGALRERAAPDKSLEFGRNIVAQSAPRQPLVAFGNVHGLAQACDLARIHHARVVVLMPGERQAEALDGIGDEQSRRAVLRRIEGFD